MIKNVDSDKGCGPSDSLFISSQKNQSCFFAMNSMEIIYQGWGGKKVGEIHKGCGPLPYAICIISISCAEQVICYLRQSLF